MTPKWHQVVRQRLQEFADQLGIRSDEQPVFADWLPDQDDVATAHNILDEQPPPAPEFDHYCRALKIAQEEIAIEHKRAERDAWLAYADELATRHA